VDVQQRINSVAAWRHRIEVAPGVVTPGHEDTAEEWRRLRVPSDLSGKRVLDVGCSDGFYSFACQQLGAEVTAIDDESSLLAGGLNGFQVAQELLGSRVEYRTADVHALPESLGTFDLILFINVLYHLRNPLLALDELAAAAKPGARLILKTYFRQDVRFWVKGRPVAFDISRSPKWWFFPNSELAGDPTNWFAPNKAALLGALEVCGWEPQGAPQIHGDRLYIHALRR